ncbi:MAG: hypothetical protein PQJ61_09585 [Spirochaetales bacterium]|uniref:Uncharacterized protein n=1 Tax=Candidatus Thalassospirochaeta sargassi TaxID=3119039 RepID=A0AAJ1ICX8_9SPIO|nr:hypothetical protein [Spirochaetales bacterium]
MFEESDLPYSTCDDFLKIIVDVPILSEFKNKIIKLCALSDMLGFTSEKTKKKTSFQSTINDQCHLSYGLKTKYFVTEDKNLYKKGLLIKKYLKLNVEVFKIDDFIIKILRLMKKDKKKIELIVKSENGDEIYRYEA